MDLVNEGLMDLVSYTGTFVASPFENHFDFTMDVKQKQTGMTPRCVIYRMLQLCWCVSGQEGRRNTGVVST